MNRSIVVARLASGNENKLTELRRALPDVEIQLLDSGPLPPETGAAYLDNARGKARFARGLAGKDEWVMGEDSGIEVDALGGRPGVESARWAEDGVAKLLQELGTGKDRRARYVCELVAIAPDGAEVRATGTLSGTITDRPRGSEGFGYDPIFVPDGERRTVAELGNDWKREHSHRARAAAALRDELV